MLKTRSHLVWQYRHWRPDRRALCRRHARLFCRVSLCFRQSRDYLARQRSRQTSERQWLQNLRAGLDRAARRACLPLCQPYSQKRRKCAPLG